MCFFTQLRSIYMATYKVRMIAMVECEVEAESIESAYQSSDLNPIDMKPLALCEIYDVIEAEEV